MRFLKLRGYKGRNFVHDMSAKFAYKYTFKVLCLCKSDTAHDDDDDDVHTSNYISSFFSSSVAYKDITCYLLLPKSFFLKQKKNKNKTVAAAGQFVDLRVPYLYAVSTLLPILYFFWSTHRVYSIQITTSHHT